MTLDELKKGQIASISGFATDREDLVAKLREIGFAETDEVELMHRGPLGARPLCFRLNRTLIAVRAEEASAVEIEAVRAAE